jgi:thiol-disulfide isomerase/thioredoxin
MKFFFITTILIITLKSFSFNDTIVKFSTVMERNFSEYVAKSNIAYLNKDYTGAEALFQTMVNEKLIGSKFDDFSFKRIKKNRIYLNESIKTPTIILTYASWCLIDKGEIPAINKLANEYKGKIKIIVVFWNTKEKVKKIAKNFNSQIEVCYASEKSNKDLRTVYLLRNTLGFPTSYYLDANKNIISIQKRSKNPIYKINYATSFKNNYESFNSEILKIILPITNQRNVLAKI